MIGNQKYLVSLDEGVASQVTLGDAKLQNIEGKGVIAIKTKGGNSKLVSDVFYVPNLQQNLLSIGQLLHKVYFVVFDKEECKILDKKKNQIVAKVKLAKNKVFPLIMPHKDSFSLKVENIDDFILWHLRYGHLNYKS